MRSDHPHRFRRNNLVMLAAACGLLACLAAPARAQLTLSPDRILIRCGNGHCSPGTATLTNVGNTTVTIYSIAISGRFNQTNNCASMAPGAFCSINLTTVPGSGNSTGTLTVNDSAPNSPQNALIKVVGNSGS